MILFFLKISGWMVSFIVEVISLNRVFPGKCSSVFHGLL